MATFGAWVTRGAALALGFVLVALVAGVAIAARNVLVLVFVAVILASGLEPFIGWLRGHLPIRRGVAILLVYGLFLASVIGLALVVLPAALSQIDQTLNALGPMFERARTWAAGLRPAGLARSATALVDAAASALRPGAVNPAPGQVVQVGLTVAEALTSIATLLTVVYFWLTEHARLQRYALAFVPQARRARARDLWNEAETRLGMWVRGQVILMASIGFAAGTAYTLLGVPSAVLLGVIAALAEGIPIVGPLLGAIPAVVVAATVSPELALAVGGVYLVLQLIEGNVLVPLVMRNTVGISPFLVILSILIGAAAGGLVGALLAVPVAATAEVLLEGLQARRIPVAQDPTASVEPDAVIEEFHDAPDAPAGGVVAAGRGSS